MDNYKNTRNTTPRQKATPSSHGGDPYRESIGSEDFPRAMVDIDAADNVNKRPAPDSDTSDTTKKPSDFVAEAAPNLVRAEKTPDFEEIIGNPHRTSTAETAEVVEGERESFASKIARVNDTNEVAPENEHPLAAADQEEELLVQQKERLEELETELLGSEVVRDDLLGQQNHEVKTPRPEYTQTIDVDEILSEEKTNEKEKFERTEKASVSNSETIFEEIKEAVPGEKMGSKQGNVVGGQPSETKTVNSSEGGDLKNPGEEREVKNKETGVISRFAEDFSEVETNMKNLLESRKLLESKSFDELYENFLEIPEFKGVVGRFALKQMITIIEGVREGTASFGMLPEDPLLRNHIIQLLAVESASKIIEFKELEAKPLSPTYPREAA